MDIGTRVRVTSINDVYGSGLDYSRMVGATATIVEDPIGRFRSWLGVDQVLPHTIKLDDPTLDPSYETILEVDPEHVGVMYLAEDEVEVIENTENEESSVNA